MPRVPSERSGISLNVPGVSINPERFGAVNESIGRLGAQIAEPAMDLLGRVKQEEARDAVSQAKYQQMVEAETFSRELVEQNPDGYVTEGGKRKLDPVTGAPVTVTQAYREWANRKYEETQLAMPSAIAQQMYQAELGPYYTTEIIKMEGKEQELKVNSFQASVVQGVQHLGNDLASKPSLDKFYKYSDSLLQDVREQGKTLRLSPTVIQKQEQAIKEQLTTAMLEGAKGAILEGKRNPDFKSSEAVDYWLSVLHDAPTGPLEKVQRDSRYTNGLHTPGSSLDPDKKARYIQEFAAIKERASAIDMAEAQAQVEVVKNALARGDQVPLQKLLNPLNALFKAGKIPPTEYATQAADAIVQQYMHEIRKPQYALMSDQALKNYATQTAPGAIDAFTKRFLRGDHPLYNNVSAEVTNQFAARSMPYVEALIDERRKDFHKFLAGVDRTYGAVSSRIPFGNFSTVLNSPSAVEAWSASQRIARTRYQAIYGTLAGYKPMSVAQSKTLVSKLTDPTTSTTEGAGILRSIRALGADAPAVLSQMVEDGKAPPSYLVAAVFPDQLRTELLYDALKGSESLNARMDSIFQASAGTTKRQLSEDIANNSDFKRLIRAIYLESPRDHMQEKLSKAINFVAENFVKGQMTAGEDTTDAVRGAFATLIGQDSFVFEAGGGWFSTGKKSAFFLPKRIDGVTLPENTPKAIDAFVEKHHSAEGLKALGIKPPKGWEFDEERFYTQAARNGYFTTTKDKKGITYWYNLTPKGELGAPVPATLDGDKILFSRSIFDAIKPEAPKPAAPKTEPKRPANARGDY